MSSAHFVLIEHPWLFLAVFILSFLVCNSVASTLLIAVLKQPRDAPTTGLWINLLAHGVLIFVLVPFVLGFPERPLSYTAYLTEIRLTQWQPALKLILLGVSCWLILALSQVAGTLIYRLSQRQPIDLAFFRANFPLESEFPPHSMGWLGSFISIFEEISYRGVILAVFLRFYDQPRALLFSALVFGITHILGLLGGHAPIWVAGQVVWASIMGLFYGYVTLKTGSLLPAMLVHYLGNLFIFPLTAYLQKNASMPVQTIYGIIFSLGAIPAALMSLWVRVFTSWWSIVP